MGRLVCPDCGEAVEPDWWFCASCHGALDPASQPPPPAAPPSAAPPPFAEAATVVHNRTPSWVTEDLVLDGPAEGAAPIEIADVPGPRVSLAPPPSLSADLMRAEEELESSALADLADLEPIEELSEEIEDPASEMEQTPPPPLAGGFLTELPVAIDEAPPSAEPSLGKSQDVGSYRMIDRVEVLGMERPSLDSMGRATHDLPGAHPVRLLLDAATKAEQGKRVDEAIELLEQAVEARPDASVYHRLGVLLATHTPYHARARALLETAIALAPTNTAYPRSLARFIDALEGKSKGQDPRDLVRSLTSLLGKPT